MLDEVGGRFACARERVARRAGGRNSRREL